MDILKKIMIIFFNIVFLFLCSYFLFRVLENPVILFDDVWDYIVSDFNFYHGRIISELIGVCIIKFIPKLLNISLQDFAIVSENLVKIFLYSLTPWFFTSFILKIKFTKNIFWGLIYLLFFAYIYALPYSSSGGNLMFSTLMFFCCYILPIPFFVLLISKIYDVYVFDVDVTKNDIIWLAVLSVFVMQANEMVGCIAFVILFCIYLEHLIKNKNIEKKDKKSFKLFSVFLSMVVANIIIYSSSGFKMMFRDYYDASHVVFSLDAFVKYVQICIDKIIFENWYIMVPLLIGIVAIVCLKNKEKANIFKFFIYSFLGIIVLSFALYCMGPTCHYAIGNEKNYDPYWILYAPVAIVIQICFLELVLLSVVYLFNKNNKILSIFISIILVVGCVYFMLDYKHLINEKVYSAEQRRRQYLIDKMMVFYSKKNQIAVLPEDNLRSNYSITENNQMMPYEVFLGIDNNKIYGEYLEYRAAKPFHILKFPEIYYVNVFSPKFPYVETIQEPEIHFIDNVSNFNLPIFPYINETYDIKVTNYITFRPEKEAISIFRKNGGTLTEAELENLEFSEILE